MIQREKENAAPSLWAISAKANVWTPLYIYIYSHKQLWSLLWSQDGSSSAKVNREWISSLSLQLNPEQRLRKVSVSRLCSCSRGRSHAGAEWRTFWLLTNYSVLELMRLFYISFLFASTNRLLLLLLLTNVPVDSDTELILTDWLYWTVTQRLQTLRGDCETKTKTFIHPEQRGGKLHNSGKSQCVFERRWDSKRERERDDEHLKHKTFSDVRGDKDVPVHFRCWDDGGAWRWRGCRRLFTRKYFRSHKWIIL